jgi:hypothetical protein
MAKQSKSEKIISDTQLLAGIQKYLPNTTLTIQAAPESTAQVATVLQARITKIQAVLTARAALHSAVLAATQEVSSTEPFVQDVRLAVLAMYSTSPSILGDFGVSARKQRTPLTTEQRLIAVAKGKATRVARGTMGAKKKAAIVGTVTGAIMVPVDGSASSVVSSTPSASPPAVTAAPAATAITNGTSTPHS